MTRFLLVLTLWGVVSTAIADQGVDVSACKGYESCEMKIRAWIALERGRFEEVIEVTGACISRYEEAARNLQASLSTVPTGDEVHTRYGVLNDVGECYFIKGEALNKLDRPS